MGNMGYLVNAITLLALSPHFMPLLSSEARPGVWGLAPKNILLYSRSFHAFAFERSEARGLGAGPQESKLLHSRFTLHEFLWSNEMIIGYLVHHFQHAYDELFE
jgi:hypothetical protein